MNTEKEKYLPPVVMIAMFGGNDFITSSADYNSDPFENDQNWDGI